MEFENTVDRGSAVNFGADSADCACLDVRILGPKREIWIIQNISLRRSSFKLRPRPPVSEYFQKPGAHHPAKTEIFFHI